MPRPDSSVVERGPEKAGVGGSIPSLATTFSRTSWRPRSNALGSSTESVISVGHLFFLFLNSLLEDMTGSAFLLRVYYVDSLAALRPSLGSHRAVNGRSSFLGAAGPRKHTTFVALTCWN